VRDSTSPDCFFFGRRRHLEPVSIIRGRETERAMGEKDAISLDVPTADMHHLLLKMHGRRSAGLIRSGLSNFMFFLFLYIKNNQLYSILDRVRVCPLNT
jgi:hypothetical protein